jgi:hypothetical protein
MMILKGQAILGTGLYPLTQFFLRVPLGPL